MPTIEAGSAIGVATSLGATGVGAIGSLAGGFESFSPLSISSGLTSGLSGGSLGGPINPGKFATLGSYQAPYLNSFNSAEALNLGSYAIEVQGFADIPGSSNFGIGFNPSSLVPETPSIGSKFPSTEARLSFVDYKPYEFSGSLVNEGPVNIAPIIGEDASLSPKDQAQLKETELSFMDTGSAVEEAQRIIKEAAKFADPRSDLVRHLNAKTAPNIETADVIYEQVIDSAIVENPAPVELTPVIRTDEATYVEQVSLDSPSIPEAPLIAIRTLDEEEEERKRREKQALAERVAVLNLEPNMVVDQEKLAQNQDAVVALLERYELLTLKEGKEVATKTLAPIISELEIFVEEKPAKEKTKAKPIIIVKDESAQSARENAIKGEIARVKKETKSREKPEITGGMLAAAMLSTPGVEGQFQPKNIDGSLTWTALKLVEEIKPSKSLNEIERQALGILQISRPGEVALGGSELRTAEVARIENPVGIVKTFVALIRKIASAMTQDFIKQTVP